MPKRKVALEEPSEMKTERHGRGQLMRGARELAVFIFGDEDRHRSVYAMVGELPIFMLGGRLSAYTKSLERAIAEKEAAATRPAAETSRQGEAP
jgi:hypothetical protein